MLPCLCAAVWSAHVLMTSLLALNYIQTWKF
jgi:hypothetical protein